jgi:hypothetical protein
LVSAPPRERAVRTDSSASAACMNRSTSEQYPRPRLRLRAPPAEPGEERLVTMISLVTGGPAITAPDTSCSGSTSGRQLHGDGVGPAVVP